MAGKRQHYIPRFLLDGFASRIQGENSYVWCFRKDSPPFESNTEKVGLQNIFYGDPGTDSLDEFITNKLETRHSTCVSQVRHERRLTSSADAADLIEFVYSLVLRTGNLRDTMMRGFSSILNEMQATFTNAEATRLQLLKEQRKNTPMWNKALTDYVRAKYGNLPHRQEKYVKKREHESFKRWLIHGAEAHIQQQVALNQQKLAETFDQLEEMAKTSHNNALRKFLQPGADTVAPRYNRYHQLRWQVQSFQRGELILGDVTVLQFEHRIEKFSAAFDGDKGDIILLPLSDDLLVIGTAGEIGEMLSSDDINRASAKLSQNFFVASQNSEREKVYQGLLRQDTFRAPKILAS